MISKKIFEAPDEIKKIQNHRGQLENRMVLHVQCMIETGVIDLLPEDTKTKLKDIFEYWEKLGDDISRFVHGNDWVKPDEKTRCWHDWDESKVEDVMLPCRVIEMVCPKCGATHTRSSIRSPFEWLDDVEKRSKEELNND